MALLTKPVLIPHSLDNLICYRATRLTKGIQKACIVVAQPAGGYMDSSERLVLPSGVKVSENYRNKE